MVPASQPTLRPDSPARLGETLVFAGLVIRTECLREALEALVVGRDANWRRTSYPLPAMRQGHPAMGRDWTPARRNDKTSTTSDQWIHSDSPTLTPKKPAASMSATASRNWRTPLRRGTHQLATT